MAKQVFIVKAFDYESDFMVAVFDDESEADRYADERNAIEDDFYTYEVEPWDVGPQGQAIWFVSWHEQYHVGKEIHVQHRWWDGNDDPGAATIASNHPAFHHPAGYVPSRLKTVVVQ